MATKRKKKGKKRGARKARAPRSGGKRMTATQVAAKLAEKVGVTKAQAKAMLAEYGDMAVQNSAAGFKIVGVGILQQKRRPARAARDGRNPSTGETIRIKAQPAKTVLKFRVAKAAKDAI